VRPFRAVAVLALASLALAGCVSRESGDASTTPSATSEDRDTGGGSEAAAEAANCRFTKDEAGGTGKFVGLPPADGAVDATSLTLTTSAGEITVELDEDQAPCTVRSMVFLAGKGYFDGTRCHRLTVYSTLKVLQCGDPLSNGTGGPGYVVPDELPTDLPEAPAVEEQAQTVVYSRGLVAMANAGPETGGSQFFLVYGDSNLPAAYSVFGTIDQPGLATLDEIAGGGIAPGASAEDGEPAKPVTITTAVAG
jgi:peptidyl-prolyl cis-trans isomerase B (cyclophilin B)